MTLVHNITSHTIQVFLGDKSVHMNPVKLCTEEDLFTFIDTVDKMQICPGR